MRVLEVELNVQQARERGEEKREGAGERGEEERRGPRAARLGDRRGEDGVVAGGGAGSCRRRSSG